MNLRCGFRYGETPDGRKEHDCQCSSNSSSSVAPPAMDSITFSPIKPSAASPPVAVAVPVAHVPPTNTTAAAEQQQASSSSAESSTTMQQQRTMQQHEQPIPVKITASIPRTRDIFSPFSFEAYIRPHFSSDDDDDDEEGEDNRIRQLRQRRRQHEDDEGTPLATDPSDSYMQAAFIRRKQQQQQQQQQKQKAAAVVMVYVTRLLLILFGNTGSFQRRLCVFVIQFALAFAMAYATLYQIVSKTECDCNAYNGGSGAGGDGTNVHRSN